MNILYITSKPIYPKIDGGCVASANFLEVLLGLGCSVKHLTIATDKHPFNLDNYPKRIIESTQPEAQYANTRVTPLKALKAYFNSSTSYNISRFYNHDFDQKITETLESSTFDLVILDSLYTSIYLDSIRKVFNKRILIRTHNVEYEIWNGLSINSKGFKKSYFRKLADNLKNYELSTLNKADGVLTLSMDDEKRLKEIGVNTAIKNIPVSIEPYKCARTSVDPIRFVHIGAMNWQPNIEAVQQLMSVFPKIREKLPDAELHIAGIQIPENLTSNVDSGIYIDGFVKNVKDYLCTMNILISPIQSGSGIRIKILEGMACGIPCITTPLGALGIDHLNSNCLIIAEKSDDLVNKAIELGSDPQLQQTIGTNALNYIREFHNIEKISSELFEFIQRT